MQLILASASQGRKQLLSLFNIPFEMKDSNVNEDEIIGKNPLATIRLRARLKAEAIAEKIITKRMTLEAKRFLILGADSDADFNGKIVGKPKNAEDAKRILQDFSGKTHSFYTYIHAIRLENGLVTKTWETYDRSLVTMRHLTEEDINLHIKLSDYTKYAGGYALFASPIDLITKIEGSLTNVVGLPLEKLLPILIENQLIHF